MNLRLSCALAVLLLCPFMALAQKNSGYDAGYHPTVEAGLVLNGNVAAVSVVTSQGYCFGNGLYIGGMTGIVFGSMSENGGRAQAVPVMGEIKYGFMDSLASPFVGLRTGMVLDVSSVGIGFVLRPVLGVDIGRFALSVGLNLQTVTYDIRGTSGSMSSGGGPFFSGFTPGNAGNSGVYAGVSYCF